MSKKTLMRLQDKMKKQESNFLIPQAKKRKRAKTPVTKKFQGLSSVIVYSLV